jgi:hypothetical protein
MSNHTTNTALRKQLENLWIERNGSGTDACSRCRSPVICSWHAAMIDEEMTLFEQYQAEAVREARIDELRDLELWFQQYGYEMHVSHVCPQDNIDCAKFNGRTQKMYQVHREVKDRLAHLTKEEGKP